MRKSYLEPYLNLILELTKVLSGGKLFLYSIKANKKQRKVFFCIFVVKKFFLRILILRGGIFKLLNLTVYTSHNHSYKSLQLH